MALVQDITASIGNTPLVMLSRMGHNLPGRVAVKLESRNPGGSVKDRIALAMIRAAESAGQLRSGGRIVEPTSGNTGIGLALVGAARGYRVTLVMPDTMSIERRRLMAAYGAELVLTPGKEGMKGAIAEAERIAAQPGVYMPMQFANPSNPDAHYTGTGPEIWQDSDGSVDIFVAGVGTGGTLTGVGRFLREQKPGVELYAVEPEDSAVLSGGQAGPHKIQGIGAGFVPDVLDRELYNGVIRISAQDAGAYARRLAAEEGILCGISSGANLCAAFELAGREANRDRLIVTVVCDSGERYLSTWLYNPEEL